MSTADQFSFPSAGPEARKPWVTPVVIVGNASNDTFAKANTPATDATATTGSTYGS